MAIDSIALVVVLWVQRALPATTNAFRCLVGAMAAAATSLRDEAEAPLRGFLGASWSRPSDRLPRALDVVLVRQAPASEPTGTEAKLQHWLNCLHGRGVAPALG